MELSTLENWLWRAACSIRGEVDAARYKDYILPLIFYKRLDDVYADELARLAQELGMDVAQAEQLASVDRSLIRFYIPHEARWNEVRKRTEKLGERLTDTLRNIARDNPKLEGVINRRDFNATDQGQRVLDDDVLARLIGILSEHPLGLNDVQPDILGRAYEYLIRKFAERGSSAGEFFTPTEVGFLIARILDPQPGEIIYDPTAGSGGLLIKAQLRHREKLGQQLGKSVSELTPDDDPRPINLCGQELQADNVAAAKMNSFIHDMVADIRQGNTMRNPAFLTPDGGLQRFDKLAANPMWNQDNIAIETYENDQFGRFQWGIPPASSADWGWIQHMYASLQDSGRMAVVLDTGAASRGSGNKGANKERDIRKQFVDADVVDAVILLPDNLFFNTPAPGIIMVLRKPGEQPRDHADEILLINATTFCSKGRPKNYMTDEQVTYVADLYLQWRQEDHVSKVVKRAEVIHNDYNLSPTRYVTSNNVEPPLPLEDAIVRLREAEEARMEADRKLDMVMQKLGFANWRDFHGKANNDAAN
jgi:type I restriction enzyme M protein